MSLAVTHGKISRSGASLTSASEDLMTASVFGPVRYLPASEFLIPILEMAKTMSGDLLSIESSGEPSVIFWPWLEKSEPDVLIKFGKHVIVVEVKYLAGKSGDFYRLNENGDHESEASRDQLVREFQDLKQQSGSKQYSLIYLTAHRVMPKESIRRSMGAACEKKGVNAADFEANLYWLSWYDVWKRSAHYNSNNRFRNKIVSDIRKYLERLSLKHFAGFSSGDIEIPIPKENLFYKSNSDT